MVAVLVHPDCQEVLVPEEIHHQYLENLFREETEVLLVQEIQEIREM